LDKARRGFPSLATATEKKTASSAWKTVRPQGRKPARAQIVRLRNVDQNSDDLYTNGQVGKIATQRRASRGKPPDLAGDLPGFERD
jgi:hypothetical protein